MGDLGNVIEVTQIGGRRGSSYGEKIIIEQFWTFTTVSADTVAKVFLHC